MNMIQAILILFVIAIVFQQCTTVNLNAPLKKKEFDSYSFLKEGVESEHYVIEPLIDQYLPSITYHPSQNYFIIEAGAYYQKLDKLGKEVFKIMREEEMELPTLTHIVFSNSGAYDLSDTTPTKSTFSEVINADRSLSVDEWKEQFDTYYASSDIVIYGDELGSKQKRGFLIYFKSKDTWVKMFTAEFTTRSYDNTEALEHLYPGYPAKFTSMVVLKDPKKNTFSNRQKEEYLLVETDRKFYQLNYNAKTKIKLKYYDKQMIDERIPYTSIPSSLSGTGFYHLIMKDDVLKFKETALKVFFRPVQNHFDWYILPDAYYGESEVSFLKFTYPHNFNESGSNGLYIIMPK